MKMKNKMKVLTFIAVSLPFTAISVANATNTTKVKVENCSNSHHEVKLTAYNTTDGYVATATATVHSGKTKDVGCTTTKCDVKFHSGSHTDTKETNEPLYVHVHSSHKMDISSSSSVCD